MKSKKTVLCALICLIICSLIMVAVACNDNHEHTYDTSWTSNSSHHWHRAICGHSEVIDKAEHEWNDGEVSKDPTCTNNGLMKYVCNICKTAKWENMPISMQNHTYSTEWSKNVSYHWYDATCGHDEKSSKVEHDFDSDGICRVCEYDINEDIVFELNSDNSSYTLQKVKGDIESDFIIPSTYNGLPITAIGDRAFIFKDLLSVNIPSSVTSIGNSAFICCEYLISIEIPSGVTSIGDSTFYKCYSLTNIEIPNGVTSIGDSAFYECNSLTSIEIPNSVTSIGEAAFLGCSSLKNIEIPSGVTNIGKRVFAGCSGLTSIEIPNRVTSIGSFAFSNCDGLTSVVVPDSVISIEDRVFFDCDGLTSVVVPDSVISIGYSAFYDCDNLENITLPFIGERLDGTGNTSFAYIFSGEGEFVSNTKYRKSLKSVKITNGTHLYDKAFINCSNLTTVEMPSTITSIGIEAFYGCSSLINIEIPSGVTNIGKRAFAFCSSLTSMKIPSGVTTIEVAVFGKCSSLIDIEIPSTVTIIDSEAFNGCSSLTSIVIPNTVTSIGSWAFSDCSSMTVYCEAESQPSGWSDMWKSSNCPVVWGYKTEQ